MNLILDIGNSFCKVFIFDSERLESKHIFDNYDANLCSFLLNIVKSGKISHTIVSSVVQNTSKISTILSNLHGEIIWLSNQTDLPIENNYGSKATLGNDRIAAAVGATTLYPSKDALIIDAGTCITYDFVSEGKYFLGGNIAPGISLRFKCLHEHTAKLPLVSAIDATGEPGTTTIEAVGNGVVQGVLFEIEGYMRYAKQVMHQPAIILTGGDAIFLAKQLKIDNFAVPNLVGIGLNRILQYNVFKKK